MFSLVGLYLSNFAYFIVVVSIIVFVHEFGHYIVAKIFKVKVEVFSIGCGPELVGFNDNSGTRWRIGLIPVAGYVKMFGDANVASSCKSDDFLVLSDEEKKNSFHEKKIYQKFLIILAGPVSNFIFAFLVFVFLFSSGKLYKPISIIGEVIHGGVAEEAGLKKGDRILSINNKSIYYFEDIIHYLQSNKGELRIEYSRGEDLRNIVIIPQIKIMINSMNEEVKISYLGIAPNYDSTYRGIGLLQSSKEAAFNTYKFIELTLSSLWKIITTFKGVQELGGPIRIAKYSGEYAKEGFLLNFMALISINLGVFNLLPIPLLDGGHLFHYVLQALLRKRDLSERYLKYASAAGMIILLSLIIFATFNDIKYIFR